MKMKKMTKAAAWLQYQLCAICCPTAAAKTNSWQHNNGQALAERRRKPLASAGGLGESVAILPCGYYHTTITES